MYENNSQKSEQAAWASRENFEEFLSAYLC